MPRHAALAPLIATAALVWAAPVEGARGADTAVADVRVGYHFNAIGAGIAELTVDIALSQESYSVSASGRTVGLVDLISRIRVSGSSEGVMSDRLIQPRRHTYTYSERGRSRTVTISYDEDGMPSVEARPAFSQSFARIPVPPERTAGTIDPASPFVVPAVDGAEALAADHCEHALSVFTGQLLFDAEVRHISSAPGGRVRGTIYEGPFIHCAIALNPIAGYKEGDFLSKMADKPPPEVWMAPILDGRYYLPVKMTVPTPFGTTELVARSISVNPAPGRASLDR